MLVRRLSPLIAVLSIAAAGTVAAAGTGDGAPAPRAVKCAGSKATLKGTKGDDRGKDKLRGTPGDDVIAAGGGADVIVASGGDDLVCGGPDKDKIRGGGGDDRLFGQGGADTLDGGPGVDACDGGRGKDVVKRCEAAGGPAGNATPTDIGISGGTIAENEPAGSQAGTLSTVDPDRYDTHVYALVEGPGAADNGRFQIEGDRLLTSQALDFEAGTPRSVRVRSTDRAGSSFERDLTIAVTDADDAPSDIALSPSTVPENEPAGTLVGSLSSTDQDAGDAHTYELVPGPGDDDNTRFQIAGAELRTAEALNFEADPSPSVRVRSTGTGGAALEEQLTIGVDDVADTPVANTDNFDAIGNTGLFVGTTRPGNEAGKEISGSLLANDTGSGTLFAEPVSNAPTTQGGTVTVEPDGNLTYHPPAGLTGVNDTFTYRLCDSSPCGPATPNSATGTVDLPITGQVWYVHNDLPGVGDGTSDGPFDTLAQAEIASGPGDTTYVFDGNNTSSGLGGGYAMNMSERLIGEAAALEVASQTLFPGTPGARPTLTASGEDVVTLATSSSVTAFDLDPAGAGGGISGTAVGNTTIADVHVDDVGLDAVQPGIELNGTTGTQNLADVTVENGGSPTATGIRISNAGTVDLAAAGTVTIDTSGARGLEAASTNLSTSEFDRIAVSGSSNGGVSLTNTTGTPELGDGTGTDLDLQTTSGAQPAFALANAPVALDPAGQNDLEATGGPAVDVVGTANVNLAFDQVSSANSANDGINITGLGAGTFSATGGSISGAAGISFDLDGGSGTINYPGNLEDGSGQAAEISGRTGGGIDLGGAISDDSDAGGGISVASNTGGTTRFSNGSKVINTLASNAISMTASDGHTLTLAGGGLDVDATSGAGISASNSGTLVVTGSGNTVDTTTGAALNLANTDFGAGGVNLERVSSNGAASGIVLSNTGSTGGLVVTGNGGSCISAATCTGGAIQNSTGAGVNLASVGGGVDLDRVSVNGGQDDGIRTATVTGLQLSNSRVTGNGNAVGEHGIDAGGLTGTVTMTSDTVTGNAENNVSIVNDAGALDATITGGTIGQNSAAIGNDGLVLNGTGTGTMNADINGTTFVDNRGDHLQMTTDASNTVTQGLTVNGATMNTTAGADPNVLGGGITVNPGGNATADVTIANTDIQQAFSSAITVDTAGSAVDPQAAQVDATIDNNTIGTPATVDSGSESADGMFISSNGLGNVDALVTDNLIRQYANLAGIEAVQNDGNGTLDLTAQRNTIANPGTFALNGIVTRSGLAASSDAGVTCLDIGSSTVADQNTVNGSGAGGGTDLRTRQQANTTVRLRGYAGGAFDTAAVASYLLNRNKIAPTASATTSGAGGGYLNTTSSGPCDQP